MFSSVIACVCGDSPVNIILLSDAVDTLSVMSEATYTHFQNISIG